MKVLDFDPSIRWLFCMTHPDDEISVCHILRSLVRNGNEVFVSWTHSTPAREAESRSAAELLGIPPSNLTFLGAPDNEVCDNLVALEPRFRKLMNDVQPDRVVCGAFEQGHIDHDATNFLVNATFTGPVIEVPFYNPYTPNIRRLNEFSDPRGEEKLELDAGEARFKKDFAKRFPSQNIWRLLLAHEAVQVVRGRKPTLARYERFRFQTHRDFRVPNHPERIRDQVAKHPMWKRWIEAVDAFELR